MPLQGPLDGHGLAAPNGPRMTVLPDGPLAAASVGLPLGDSSRNTPESGVSNSVTNGYTATPGTSPNKELSGRHKMRLELEDGTAYQGTGFGADKSIAGELVFQTGMVGYPESITDPSYRGQILVVTFPLVGNYGVPSRDAMDKLLCSLPAHFEANQIHISGLVVASYSGEDYSHHLATSSLGTWLKEQGIPAIEGIDTRVLTKHIRQRGSMLGKLLVEMRQTNVHARYGDSPTQSVYEQIDWIDPNKSNLVADGENVLPIIPAIGSALTFIASLCQRASPLLSHLRICVAPSVWSSP